MRRISISSRIGEPVVFLRDTKLICRIQLEEQYISGLNKLYSRTLAMDTLHEK